MNSADGLKPARPFWYSVDKEGLTILGIDDNRVIYRVPWPATYWLALPDGEFEVVPAPPGGWEPVGMTVTYPTEEALASNSETPPTFVYVVMAHSGYEWASETDAAKLQSELRDPNLRDKIVPSTDPATESSLLIAVDVSDPTFDPESAPMGPVVAGNILGHYAGQPAYDAGTDTLYIGNMPSTSLPANLQSFVSLIAAPAPPVPEAAAGGPPAPEVPLVNMCGPEHPDEGLLIGEPYVWACTESGDGPAVWEFQGLPPWMFAHPDKLTGELDGLLYGVPPANGTWTFQARVTDYGDTELGPQTSDWTTWTVMVSDTGVASEAEAGFEAGVPGGQGVGGTGSCEPAPTPGSLVPAWIDVLPAMMNGAVRGCYVMGTAPISGEYYAFTLPNFHFTYPFDRDPVIFSGNVVGPYMFDPLPAGVGLSGLAWHQIEKLHDPSTEADILNSEFIGVERFTGQLYRILPPQGSIEVGTVLAPPETSMELDTVTAEGQPLLDPLKLQRPDIAALFTGSQSVAFGDLVVEADRDIFVSATWLLDPATATSTPIGGPSGSAIENGALMKVVAGAPTTIDLPGVQANYLGLDSNLAPGIPGAEPGQVDNGILWVTGTTTGNVAVVNTASASVDQTLAVQNATSLGGVGVDTGFGIAYVAGESLMSVAIFGDSTARAPRSPVIWSAALTTFNVGEVSSFEVMATGSPTPQLSYSGTLPSGLTFTDNGDGTAKLGGTPAANTSGDYTITFVAANGVSPDANQTFVLSIAAAPVFISADTTTFVAGELGSFMVATTGSPTLTTMWCGDATGTVPCVYPSWLSFVDNEDGTSSFTGTPPAGEVGKSYQFTLWATTGVAPDATQLFTLNVVAPGASYLPSIVTQPLNQTVTEGETATFSAAASGWPTPTVQWEVSTDSGQSFVAIAGAVNTSFSTSAATMSMNGYRFRAVFTNEKGSATTAGALLTVNSLSAPTMTLNPSNATVTEGQTATFTAAASGSPTPTAQWQLSTDYGVSWANIGGATSASYTTSSTTMAMSGYQYRAVFTNTSGTINSGSARLTVNPAQTAPSIVLQPFAQTVTVGQSATFAAAADGNPPPTVQWQISTDSGSTWSNISGAVATSYATPAATVAMSGYRYRAVFTNVIGSATTNAAVLTVNAAPAVTTHPSNQTVLVGQTGTFTAAASGNPRPTVQWQLSTNGGSTWSNIGGATNTTYTTAATTLTMNNYRYRAVFTNVLGSATSNAAVLTVQQAPAITSANTTTFTVGQAGMFSVTTTGSPTPTLTPWGNLPNGVTFTDNGNGTATLAGTPASGSMTSYQFTITAANGVQPNAIQNFTLTVNVPQGTAPAITSASTTTFTVGTAGSFRVTTTGTPTPSLSSFGSLPTGVTFVNNGNGTGTLAGTPAAGTQGSYQFVIMATNGVGSDAYQFFTLVVNAGTVSPLAIATTSLPEGRTNQPYSAQLLATGGTQPYRWNLASGSLPRGLTLSQSGAISGTPTRTGNTTFTVRVTDAQSRTTTRNLSLRIR